MGFKHISHVLAGIFVLGAAIGAVEGLPAAHAGGGQPQVEATLVSHDINHCVKHGNVESCYTTTETSIRVSGSGFTQDGLAKVQIRDAQTLALYANDTVQAGDHGGFILNTSHRYCTQHGRLVRAYDLTSHSYSNTITIQPCGTL